MTVVCVWGSSRAAGDTVSNAQTLRIMLPERETTSGVTSVGDALNGLVSDSKILLQYSADVLLRDFDTALIVNCLNNFFRLTEAALAPEQLQ